MKTLPLENLWASLGARFAETDGWRLPLCFSGAEEEYLAARKSAALFDFSRRGKIRVTGSDRAQVLHNLLTNDILKLKPGSGCHAFFLTHQGRIVADMHVYVFDDFILMDTEAGLQQKIIEALDRFIILEDAALDEDKGWVHLALQGPKSEFILQKALGADAGRLADHDHMQAETDSGRAVILCRASGSHKRYELLVPAEDAADIAAKILGEGKAAGVFPAGSEAEEILRIEDGILKYGVDMSEEVTLPETGLDAVAASETKGCYPGQEVVARTNTYKGHTKKAGCFTAEGNEAPAAGTLIHAGEKEAGWITSACIVPASGKIAALGYLRKGYFEPDLKPVLVTAGARPLRLVRLP